MIIKICVLIYVLLTGVAIGLLIAKYIINKEIKKETRINQIGINVNELLKQMKGDK